MHKGQRVEAQRYDRSAGATGYRAWKLGEVASIEAGEPGTKRTYLMVTFTDGQEEWYVLENGHTDYVIPVSEAEAEIITSLGITET